MKELHVSAAVARRASSEGRKTPEVEQVVTHWWTSEFSAARVSNDGALLTPAVLAPKAVNVASRDIESLNATFTDLPR
jgi:hypothetical protein